MSAARRMGTMTGSMFVVTDTADCTTELLAEPEMTWTGLRGDDAGVAGEAIPREQVEQTVAGLRRLLDQVADGTMTAGSGTVARLEGAVAALEGLLAACGGAESGSARMGKKEP